MIELVQQDMETVITVSHMFKKWKEILKVLTEP